MKSASINPPRDRADDSRVVTCYALLDVGPSAGMDDFTEGIYHAEDLRNDRASYSRAQHRQTEYLLDEIRCGPDSRILDIGCGNGRLLRQAGERGARAVGISISPEQIRICRRQLLDVLLLNYRDIDPGWRGRFSGVVANGSLEHFVTVDDAANGRADEIYRAFFAICRELLAPGERLATTAIHFRRVDQLRAEDLLQGPQAFPRGSPECHFGTIFLKTFGGWHPGPGQLERCARPYFHLVREVDGTHDYHLTSEFWLRQIKRSVALNPRVWLSLMKKFARYPQATVEMLICLVWSQSWNWQFRGDPAPTRLLRQTWEAV